MNEWLVGFCNYINKAKITCDNENISKLYHYTSPEAAKSIIMGGRLRFTDRYYLNDYSEGRYVLKLCLDNIDYLLGDNIGCKELLKKELQDRYVCVQRDNFYVYQCSFSLKKDSLCMWNYYTKGQEIQGYSICFSVDCNKNIGEQILKPQVPAEYKRPIIYSSKVIYDKKRQLKIVKAIIDYFLAFDRERNDSFVISYLVDKIVQQGIFFKDSCFDVEEEYRIAIMQYVNDDGSFFAIDDERCFLVKNGMFVPYVDIAFEKEKMTEIMISPTLESEIVKQSIKMICANKYKNLKVSISQIPVRY